MKWQKILLVSSIIMILEACYALLGDVGIIIVMKNLGMAQQPTLSSIFRIIVDTCMLFTGIIRIVMFRKKEKLHVSLIFGVSTIVLMSVQYISITLYIIGQPDMLLAMIRYTAACFLVVIAPILYTVSAYHIPKTDKGGDIT